MLNGEVVKKSLSESRKAFFSIHCFNLRLIWSETILFCQILPNLEMTHTFVCWKLPCQYLQNHRHFPTSTPFSQRQRPYGSWAGACLVCECPMHKSSPDLPLPSKYTFAWAAPETVLPNFAEIVSPTLSSAERIQAASSAPAYITNFTIFPINI